MRFIWDTDMTCGLGLKGNELLVYTVIHSFSQGRKGCFFGTLEDLADIIGASRMTTIRTLQALEEKGFIGKSDVVIGSHARCAYAISQSNKMVLPKSQNDTLQSNKMVLHNNKDNNKDINTSKDVYSTRERFDFAKALEGEGVTAQHVAEFMAIRKAKKAVNTATAFDLIKSEAERCCITLDEAVKICIEESWKGFRKAYYDGLVSKRAAQQKQVSGPSDEQLKRFRELSNYGR